MACRVFDLHGYRFQHPQGKRIYFDINYSERYLHGEADPALAQTGEKFIDSFRITEIKAGKNL